jgi:hypothetical protein
VRATTLKSLLDDSAKIAEDGLRFDVILLVGHSNVSGIRLTEDRVATWSELAKWIKPFHPKWLVLACCEGGRWLPGNALFQGIDTLGGIFGTPVPSGQSQLQGVKLLALWLLAHGRISSDWLRLGQIIHFALTDGLIFRLTRTEWRRGGSEEGLAWTMIEEVLRRLLKK